MCSVLAKAVPRQFHLKLKMQQFPNLKEMSPYRVRNLMCSKLAKTAGIMHAVAQSLDRANSVEEVKGDDQFELIRQAKTPTPCKEPGVDPAARLQRIHDRVLQA